MLTGLLTFFLGGLIGTIVAGLCAASRIAELEQLVSPRLVDRLAELERWLDERSKLRGGR